jgi:two-component system, OmpR family, sensor histidine kinase KdpD
MKLINTRKFKISTQIVLSIITVLLTATACFFSKEVTGYKIVALILLMCVSVLAMLFDILPVLIAAILSALIWNFFFIPPLFTFHIDNAEDILMFFLYFTIALVNAVLTFKIRDAENKARDKEKKENSIKLYNTLINSLSHELRTPISTIIGAVDTLKENKEKLSQANQYELLNQIDLASIRLNKQVDNLLNMSRLETGLLKLTLQWCDVNELINLVIQKMTTFTTNKEILFTPCESLPICRLDGGIIEQVLQNIISNALLYTPDHSKIQILASVNQNQLTITISDNGKGIPETLLPEIFNKFYRLPNTKTGGTGLGLSIAKGFVEAHSGSIIAENILPNGLKFTIFLPVETTYINNLKNE